MIAALPAELDKNNGHPIGLGVAFFGICLFMVLLFAVIVWVGKLRDKRHGPRPAQQVPLLIKKDEERERRRRSGR